ncbi:MAG TPA: xylose isomerase [Polyangiaceae bacterium]|nr:xylose isomerase [Polyangiaceae bacterium]
MSQQFFEGISPIRFEGPQSDNPLAFRYYDKNKVVAGKTMEAHLRPAVCYWHSFAWGGQDVFGFGIPTMDRPWFKVADPVAAAEMKLEVAFEFFEKLGVPFFTFHDRDMAPEGANIKESHAILDRLTEKAQAQMARTKVGLLWGTANLFSHPRYMCGAATNPDPEVFAYAAAQVTKIFDITHKLGGQNYVLWGGREGYQTLLNTDMKREGDQLGRFLTLVAEHKQKIGFKGTLLLEPKPKEPTKHQYDFDTATVYAFLQRYHLENEYKVNIEANHAILSGHSFQHEVAYALGNGVFGSLDMNRGDPQLGWDTDQFPNDIAETAIVLYTLLKGGGFTTGGMNFDAKLRRESIDPADLFHAHIGGLDTLARGLIIADKMIQDGKLERVVTERYSGWKTPLGESIMGGKVSLKDLSEQVLGKGIDPKPRSGQQEMLEGLVNRYL